METDGYRTGSSAFSRSKRPSTNNHIKIRTLSYNQSKSTRETERCQTANENGERINIDTQYIWLRKPMGVPVRSGGQAIRKTSSFGFRTFNNSANPAYDDSN